ncbi:DUF1643 domain-containing protein [Streptomyces sp. NPDC059718]
MHAAITKWATTHRLTVHEDGTLDPTTADLAVQDSAGTYRYALTRSWGSGPTALYVMLNPSTGTATDDDATLRNCRAIARRHGFGRMVILNLFALRSRDPRALHSHPDPIGPAADNALTELVPLGNTVIAAWGQRHSELHDRAATVTRMLRKQGAAIQCLGTNRDGTPRHPLYLAAGTPLTSYEPQCAAGADAHETHR